MNIIQIQNDLKSVPDQSLIGYVKNPTAAVPTYLALGELQRRQQMRQDYAKNSVPKSTVAQDLEQTAHPQSTQTPTDEGIASLDTGEMFNEKSMASGGIVAFADNQDQPVSANMPNSGGIATSKFSRWWDEMTRKSQTNLSLDDQIQKLQKEYLSLTPGLFTKTISDQDAAASQRQQEIKNEINNLKAQRYGHTLPAPSTIPGDKVLGSQAAADAATSANLGTYKTDITQPEVTKTNVGLQNPFDLAQVSQVPVEKIGDLASYADEMKKYIGADPARAALEERLSKMDTKAAEEERVAPWMALAQAGFSMAAGKSPYALSNIGEGALAGIKSYGEAKDKLESLQEKHFSLQNDMAKADRAEQLAIAKSGIDSKQAAQARAHTEKLNNAKMQNDMKIAQLSASVTQVNKSVDYRKAAAAEADRLFKLYYGPNAALADDPDMKKKYNAILLEQYKNFGIPLSPGSDIATNAQQPSSLLKPADKGSGAQYKFGF